MRSAITLFVAAVVCVAIAWVVSALPGSITATVAGTTLQTSTPMAILLLAILFGILYGIVRLLSWLVSIPRRVRGWRGGRERSRGELAINRTLIALAANDAGGARREADRSRRLLGDTPLTLLLAAQAGRQAGREDEANALYEQLAERPDGRLLGLRGLIRVAVERQDWERATALATQAEQTHSGAAWLRDERRFMAQQTGNWKEALRLAGPDSKAALAVSAADHETDPKAALALAKQAFEADPALAPAAIAYATRLRGAGREKMAQEVLRRAWAAKPHPDLAAVYVAPIDDKLARSREIQSLVRSKPDDAEAYIAVARAALEAGLTSEARRQLEAAHAAGVEERRLYALAADVYMMDGDNEGAKEAYRNLQDASPDPVWRCTACGTHHGSWHPVCDTCRSTGTILWGKPGEVTAPVYRLQQPAGLEGLAT